MLDLKVHCHKSKDGRHWSTPEQANYVDGVYGPYLTSQAQREMLRCGCERIGVKTPAWN